jgi:anthranilate phosphoribosyltransferase
MNVAEALHASARGARLSREQARSVFGEALAAGADPIQLGALLASMATRGEDVAEIAGAADALQAAMIPFDHPFPEAIDTCGTGGDGLATFNLSTAAAIVAAAAGARVIKHGNRAISSRSGSADLLEAAGLPLELSPRAALSVLEDVGITFLFAPAYHPSLRAASSVRKTLGIRTIFNFLGPLCNPGRVRAQLVGVGDARRGPDLAAVLAALGLDRAFVVHGAGGADELTLAGDNQVWSSGAGSCPGSADGFHASALGLASAPTSALAGGDAEHNLALLHRVLGGEPGPLFDAVVLNAGAALVVASRAATAREGCELAREALDSGRAKATFSLWITTARAAAEAR